MRVPVQRVPGVDSAHGKVISQHPTLPWHHARVTFPERGEGQGWWLCTKTCQLYKKDVDGNKLFFESATPNVPRPSSTVCYAGEVYAASPAQLPADVRPKQRTFVDEDGVERPKFIRDYTNPDPNASLIPDWEYEHDPDTGEARQVMEVVGIAMFLELPNDMREAEGIVRHWRSNRTAPASMPLREVRERWEAQNRDEAAAAFGIDDLGGERRPVHAGTYQDALNAKPGDYEYEAQAAEQTLGEQQPSEPTPPAQPQASVMEQLAAEIGMPSEVVKAMLVRGGLEIAREAMGQDEAPQEAPPQEPEPAQEPAPEPEPVAQVVDPSPEPEPAKFAVGAEPGTGTTSSRSPRGSWSPTTSHGSGRASPLPSGTGAASGPPWLSRNRRPRSPRPRSPRPRSPRPRKR